MQDNRYAALRDALGTNILLLDGSMGVMIQRLGLKESDYRGRRFMTHPRPLSGNVDILSLTSPSRIEAIHEAYLKAGADIIETNSFNSNSLSQAEYGLSDYVREMNLAAARLARRVADRYGKFVAGSMGPTAFSASLPDNVEDASHRAVSFDRLSEAACVQAGALIDGGVDMLLLETAYDLLNIKAQLSGIRKAKDERGCDIPVAVSMTISDASGRLLSGHTPEAVVAALESENMMAIGFNCGTGARDLAPSLLSLAESTGGKIILYPNAGLPDKLGEYSETPSRFADETAGLIASGRVNIIGGCCGTTPDHIKALSDIVAGLTQTPFREEKPFRRPWLAGIDAFYDDNGFINVGERCNVAGSRKFLGLISEKKYEEAVGIARRQVADGAMLLDINMDDGMLDAAVEMELFARMMAADPEVARVPWMIDSSSFGVIERALKSVSGKAVVNSISLKHGEEEFLRQARIIRGYGAAVVVMAFDEEGQADTYGRRIDICRRAYGLLTEKVGFEPRDIIFDPNVLTVATGMHEHDAYALDFIRAVKWIKENLPGVRTSGGVSNLSFAFRGNNYVRQAMHAVFLYHAIAAGLDMAIVDPGSRVTYEDIEPELREAIEDVVLNRRTDATERLAALASRFSGMKISQIESAKEVPADVDERLIHALVSGDDSSLADDLEKALERHATANAVVEGPLMKGMERVGQLFETGRMFLPQVVKSSRVMRRAVEYLEPMMEAGKDGSKSKGLFLTATVKGDVHDIGKNIVNVVMRCNNYEVVDLGVQVEPAAIVEAAIRLKPDFIGLSGLISPSLNEMAKTALALADAGVTVPLFIGGAATSAVHTAMRIAPEYTPGLAVHVKDAAQNAVVAGQLKRDYDAFADKLLRTQEQLRNGVLAADSGKPAETKADNDSVRTSTPAPEPKCPGLTVLDRISIAEVRPYINWRYFFNCWKIGGNKVQEDALRQEAETLLDSLEAMDATMRAEVGLYGASSDGKSIVFSNGTVMPTPRQGGQKHLSLADFVAPEGDTVGAFMVTIGPEIRSLIHGAPDDYSLIMTQAVADRLAEATSEWLHHRVRTTVWGYAPDEDGDLDRIKRQKYQGIRPAIGYPCLPDQMLMHRLGQLLDPGVIGVEITENGALSPSSSVAGLYIASPQAVYFTV